MGRIAGKRPNATVGEVQSLLDQYRVWLKDRTSLRQMDGWVEVTTPYLDRHNDCLQIYVKRSNGGFVLTDDGYTVEDLELSGCRIDVPKRRELFETTLNGFGVRANERALEVRATESDFASRKHDLVQAMLAVNDLFHLASSATVVLFHEDVRAWLDRSEIRYTPNVRFTGKSGYGHRFDFVVPKSNVHPERMVRSINRPDRETAQAAAFSWIDVRDARPAKARAYAIVNDSGRRVPDSVMDAMRNYEMRPILWSERDRAREELAA